MPVVIRTCVGCGCRRDQTEFVRYQRRASSRVEVSFRPAEGRSAYVCPRHECLRLAIRRRAFERAWRRTGKVVYDPAALWSELVTNTLGELDRLEKLGPTEARLLRRVRSVHTEMQQSRPHEALESRRAF